MEPLTVCAAVPPATNALLTLLVDQIRKDTIALATVACGFTYAQLDIARTRPKGSNAHRYFDYSRLIIVDQRHHHSAEKAGKHRKTWKPQNYSGQC